MCWDKMLKKLYIAAFIHVQEFDQSELLTELQRLIKDPSLSDKVLSLLNKLLNNKYPKFADLKTLQIQEILAWKLWPNFIKMFGKWPVKKSYVAYCTKSS